MSVCFCTTHLRPRPQPFSLDFDWAIAATWLFSFSVIQLQIFLCAWDHCLVVWHKFQPSTSCWTDCLMFDCRNCNMQRNSWSTQGLQGAHVLWLQNKPRLLSPLHLHSCYEVFMLWPHFVCPKDIVAEVLWFVHMRREEAFFCQPFQTSDTCSVGVFFVFFVFLYCTVINFKI